MHKSEFKKKVLGCLLLFFKFNIYFFFFFFLIAENIFCQNNGLEFRISKVSVIWENTPVNRLEFIIQARANGTAIGTPVRSMQLYIDVDTESMDPFTGLFAARLNLPNESKYQRLGGIYSESNKYIMLHYLTSPDVYNIDGENCGYWHEDEETETLQWVDIQCEDYWHVFDSEWKDIERVRIAIKDFDRPANLRIRTDDAFTAAYRQGDGVAVKYGTTVIENPDAMQHLWMERIYSNGQWIHAHIDEQSSYGLDDVLNTSVFDGSGPECIIENDFVANNMHIHTQANLSVASGASLTVFGDLVNEGELVTLNTGLHGTGSLIHHSPDVRATALLNISVDESSEACRWHLISTPVAGQQIQPGFLSDPPLPGEDFYFWHEADDTWVNSRSEGVPPAWNERFDKTLIPGKGYLVAYNTGSTRSFSGILHTDDILFNNLSVSGTGIAGPEGYTPGWHLLGNPFSSGIKWDPDEWSTNNIAAIGKIWSQGGYIDISSLDGAIIPAMQGFFVQALQPENQIVIPSSQRVHGGQWLKKEQKPRILLVAKAPAGKLRQEHVIRFFAGDYHCFDPGITARFMAGNAPAFYAICGDERLSTIALSDGQQNQDVIFGFQKNHENNKFVIIAEEAMKGIEMLLTDLKTNTVHQLYPGNPYLFDSFDEVDDHRFIISFINSGISTGFAQIRENYRPARPDSDDGTSMPEYHIFTNGEVLNLHFNDPSHNRHLRVYDHMGQLLKYRKLGFGKRHHKRLPFPPGVYLVSVQSEKEIFSQSVYIGLAP